MSEKNNMRIWEQVCTTDPANTKHIDQRGGFTAIDAYSQIQRATEVFGPVGEGWGWGTADSKTKDHPDLCVVHIGIWYDGDREKFFPVFGAVPWIPFGNKVDADAPKKALTDAITKGLSYLGFNADVFQGKFPDNKYTGGTGSRPVPNTAESGVPAPEPPTHEDGAPFTGSGTIKYLEEKPTSSKFKLQTEDALIRVLCWSDSTREAVKGYDSPTLKDSLVTVHGIWSSWTNDAGAVYWSVKAEDINPNLPF